MKNIKSKIRTKVTDKNIEILIPKNLLVFATENREDYRFFIKNKNKFFKEFSKQILEGTDNNLDLYNLIDDCCEKMFIDGHPEIVHGKYWLPASDNKKQKELKFKEDLKYDKE